MRASADTRPRTSLWPFVGAWLLACAILLAASVQSIANLDMPDPDDTLRLQQVRDWIAGQSWFDVSQYRMNPPDGAPMHWSRLVDVPIATMILLLRPLLGNALAETTALVAVPLLTLGLVMGLTAALTRRLLDREHAILAALLAPVSAAAMQQLRPLRIDHHGWQLALALAAVLAALDPRRTRSGLIAGAATALWLHISLEGLPFAGALAALFATRWLFDAREGTRLTAFAGALAGGSALLFVLTKAPAVWGAVHCDAVSLAHLVALGVAAIGCVGIVRLHPRLLWLKLCLFGTLGAAMLAVMALLAPACAAGPFAALDPVVHEFWYESVLEGRPLWHQSTAVAAAVIAFPLVGLFGSGRAWSRATGERRTRWAVLLFLLCAATLTAVFVQRAGALANLLALPGGVYLLQAALVKARAIRPAPLRLAAMLAALLIVAPAYAIIAIDMAAARAEPEPRTRAVRDCVTREEIAKLNLLPAGVVASPLDVSPAIILFTNHKVIASGHHRNGAAMRDVIDIFTLAPEAARERLKHRRADYIAVCPNLIEPALFREHGPNGLWAQIGTGRTPAWLEAVRLPGGSPLMVWRVRQS